MKRRAPLIWRCSPFHYYRLSIHFLDRPNPHSCRTFIIRYYLFTAILRNYLPGSFKTAQ